MQRNVQAAVDAATARDLSASGGPSVEASLAGSVRSLRLTGADHGSTGAELPAEQARSCPGAGQDPEPDCATSQAPGSSAADPLNVPGQPQVAVRLHKARIKVRTLSSLARIPKCHGDWLIRRAHASRSCTQIPSLGLEGKFVEAAVSQRGSTTLQALERDLEAARAQIKVKSTEAREAQEELRAFRSERTSASKANRALEGQIARLQKQVDGLKGQVAARDVALKQAGEAAGERERGQREAEGHLQSRSARLNRALEEVQRYRKLLEEAKVRLGGSAPVTGVLCVHNWFTKCAPVIS